MARSAKQLKAVKHRSNAFEDGALAVGSIISRNPVLVGDILFGLSTRNSGQYFAVDVKTGKSVWTSEPRQAGQAAVVKAGPIIFSLEDDGELVVGRVGTTAFEPLRRYKVADSETWTQPTISGNRLFVKDVSTLTLWTIP